jgi:hypothetical protein
MYIDINTGVYPVTEGEIRTIHSNVSFASPFQPPENYRWVFTTPPPECNPITQTYTQTTPELTNKGVWEVRWLVVDKFQDYTDQTGVVHTKQQQEQEALAKAAEEKLQQTVKTYEAAIDSFFDQKAKEKGYDSRITCALRAGFVGPFQQEGIAFAQWMDNCYSYIYQVLEQVKANTRPQPTIEELLAELPVLTWPTN